MQENSLRFGQSHLLRIFFAGDKCPMLFRSFTECGRCRLGKFLLPVSGFQQVLGK